MTELNGTNGAQEEKEACHVCGAMYTARYLHTHLRKNHGIYGGRTGRARRDRMALKQSGKSGSIARQMPIPTVEVLAEKKQSFKVVPFLVLEDQDGGLWLAERLK